MGIAKEYIFNQSDKDKTKANILINDDISAWWGIGLREMSDDISSSGATDIMIQINTLGGSVFEGNAIASFITGYPANIDTSILGVCASIGTVIAVSGRKTSISKGSRFMIHNATVGLRGESKDLRHTADLLDSIDEDITNRYVSAIKKNGKLINDSIEETKAQVKKWQNEETWFSAEKAVEHGFIQTLVDGVEFLNKSNSKAIYNTVSKYKNVPVEFLNKVKSIANMATEKKPVVEDNPEKGLFDHLKAFFIKEEAPTKTAPVTELTAAQKLEAAKALLLENGLKIEPVAMAVPPVKEDTETADLKAKLATAEADKEAALLVAQKLQEEKDGAGSAGKPNMHKATPDKPLTEEQEIENLLSDSMPQLNALADAMNE
jgi:ATP-dependent Clp protease protease subunit